MHNLNTNQRSPRITEEQRRGALSAIYKQPRSRWSEYVYMLGLEHEASEMPTGILFNTVED